MVAMKTLLFGFVAISAPSNKPLTDFESKIKAEGVAHRVRGEFPFSNLAFVVDTEQKEKANVEADLEQLGTASPFLQTKIYDLV